MLKQEKPIAIIGAGIAGLACARRLQAGGTQVELFDKARGPGGRAATRRGEGWQCDHGAQYFTARDPEFVAEVAGWKGAGVVSRWQPRLIAIEADGCRPAGEEEVRYVGQPRMSALGRHLAEGLRIHTGTRITALGREGADWVFATEDGEIEQTYSAVILTPPAPQTAALLMEAAPAFAEVARQCRMRGCWALMAHYERDPGLDFDAAFVNHGPLSWLAREASKPGRPESPTWLLHAPAAEWTEDTLDYVPDDVADAMLEAFEELTGAPRPAAWTLHRWLYANNMEGGGAGSLWDPVERIGVAGDWLMGGRIEGAWLSGTQLARAILEGPPDDPLK